jgi:ABC-type transporter Mla subunit MlaD
VGRTQQRADAAIEAVGRTQQGADEAITAVRETTDRAGETLTGAEGLLGRMDRLAEPYEEPLRALAPSVRRLAETLDPSEVEAVVRLIDQLPQLVGHLEDDILPVLGSLGNVGSDVRDLLDTMQDLRQVVKGFPGSRLFRRRGAEEIAHDEAEEDEAVGETGADRRVAGS